MFLDQTTKPSTAVLTMNLAAPLIDNYTQPRTYGHQRRERD